MTLGHDIKKYWAYLTDTKSFLPSSSDFQVSENARWAARSIRGEGRGPAVMVHGIMPRSGTVYVGELLRLHPHLYGYPNQMWEIPFLQFADDLEDLQARFLLAYEQNVGKLGRHDFLPLFGASLLAYLHSFVPKGRRVLLKVPSVQLLDRFFCTFPHENLLVLVRDGRDVVHSTLKTWPQLRFSMVCHRWNLATRMVLGCHERFKDRSGSYWLARFEDAVREPETFVREACRRFGLDETEYPFERIESIPLRGSSSLVEDGKVVWRGQAKPHGFRPVGRWENWSVGRKWIFKRLAGQSLLELGYCQDLTW